MRKKKQRFIPERAFTVLKKAFWSCRFTTPGVSVSRMASMPCCRVKANQ